LRSGGGAAYAPIVLTKAEDMLQRAEDYYQRKQDDSDRNGAAGRRRWRKMPGADVAA